MNTAATTLAIPASAWPKIGSALNAGAYSGTYAGITTGPDGVSYALVLLDIKPTASITWQQALDWAKTHEADLPNRVEGALLYANLKEQFEPEWHWLNEQYSRNSAWNQYFDDGTQVNYTKSYEAHARAVRRFSIDSFNQFLSEVAA